jgi:glutathione transport system permease protein
MLASFVRRLLSSLPVIFLVSFLVFVFIRLIPGDPAMLIAGPDASGAEIAAIRDDLGLNQPIWRQYLVYLANSARGDFGESIQTRRPVIDEIGDRFMPTLWLTLASLLWTLLFGVVLGVYSGIRRGTWQDRVSMVVAVTGVSFPNFWLGLLLINLFSVRLGWLPTSGFDHWTSLLMPSFTLGTAFAAILARFTRSAYLEVANEDYVRTARSKGIPEQRVVWHHILRNALIPVITLTGLEFGNLLGGAIIVETVFAWPGVGRLLVDSIGVRDYPVIQALILLFAIEFMLINLIVDVIYGLVNPEVRLR